MKRCAALALAIALVLTGCNWRRGSYSEDLSAVDAAYRLSWFEDDRLHTYDFAAGAETVEVLESKPHEWAASDAPDGFVYTAGLNGETLCFPEQMAVPDADVDQLYGWYGGRLYYEWRCGDMVTDDGKNYTAESRTACYDAATGEVRVYESEDALCVSSAGDAAALREGVLGIEGPDGSWMEIASVGEGDTLPKVACASWLDKERLLLIVGSENGKDWEAHLWAAGGLEALRNEKGKPIRLYVPYSIGRYALSASPDGRYIAYCVTDFIEGTGLAENLLVQSLETGTCYLVAKGLSEEVQPLWRE